MHLFFNNYHNQTTNGQHNRMSKGAVRTSSEQQGDEQLVEWQWGARDATCLEFQVCFFFPFPLFYSINNYLPTGRLCVCQRPALVSNTLGSFSPYLTTFLLDSKMMTMLKSPMPVNHKEKRPKFFFLSLHLLMFLFYILFLRFNTTTTTKQDATTTMTNNKPSSSTCSNNHHNLRHSLQDHHSEQRE